jgi:transcriptional regulator with XRE-family HTH domain
MLMTSSNFVGCTTGRSAGAARGLLEWSQERLAKAARVGLSTVRDFEKRRLVPQPDNLAAIRNALERAGVKFIDTGKRGGPGVRLRR